jgi:hypothetical protein
MHPLGERGDLWQALRRVFAPEDMGGGEGELDPGPGEASGVRGAGELALRVIPDRWQHDLPHQARGLDPGAVIQEGEAFAVAGGPLGRIRNDDPPVRAQAGQQPLQGCRLAAGLLHGDDIEPGDHRGQAGNGVPVPLGRVLGPAAHLAIRSPRARMFQVPTRRLVAARAGMAAAKAVRSRSRSSVTAGGTAQSCLQVINPAAGGKQAHRSVTARRGGVRAKLKGAAVSSAVSHDAEGREVADRVQCQAADPPKNPHPVFPGPWVPGTLPLRSPSGTASRSHRGSGFRDFAGRVAAEASVGGNFLTLHDK